MPLPGGVAMQTSDISWILIGGVGLVMGVAMVFPDRVESGVRSAIDIATAILILIGTILGTIALALIGAAWSASSCRFCGDGSSCRWASGRSTYPGRSAYA